MGRGFPACGRDRDVESMVFRSGGEFACRRAAVPARRGVGTVIRTGTSTGAANTWLGCLPKDLPLFAKSAGEEFSVAPRADGAGKGLGERARADLAHPAD